ncbi:hypothetical protein FE391_24070 [Nonomuraea sp. KC401]|nr:hypothetical protein [Nonomuraea sp. K271]TLF66476.1 hypothetical protein FE391_24070 [Nonomuraea sp. KC401]
MSPMSPACPRCRTGDVPAVVRVPHGWTNASGRPVRGVGEVTGANRRRIPVARPVVSLTCTTH